MSYAQRIALVTEHIAAHLDQPLDLAALAQVAGFSPFHFHRIFKSETGETLNAHVTRRRIERAALLMRSNRRRPLTDIALACGFAELASFSRAFRARYGLAPSRWDRSQPLQERKIGQAEAGLARYSDTDLDAVARQHGFVVEVRDMPAQWLAYLRITNAYASPHQIMAAHDTLMAWRRAAAINGTLVGMSEDDPEITPPALYRYDIGLLCAERPHPPEPILLRRWPACSVAAIHIQGDLALEAAALQVLYRHWLPGSGYDPAHLPCFELYHKTPEDIGWETFDMDCVVPIQRQTPG